jgi:anti-anti-sigma regulatory factor
MAEFNRRRVDDDVANRLSELPQTDSSDLRMDFVYYMHDASAAFRFQLRGDLSDERTQDLEQARQTASSIMGERRLVVDLTGLTSIDAAGRRLLKEWQVLGAQMTVISAKEQARIQLISGVAVVVVGSKAKASRWLPPQAAALLVAALFALLLATAVAAAGVPTSVNMRTPISGIRSIKRGML